MVLVAILVTTGGVFVMNAFARGMSSGMLDQSISQFRGHLKVLVADYLDQPSLEHGFDPEIHARIHTHPQVLVAAPRVRVPAVLMSERETRGAELIGIDPRFETHSMFNDFAVEGQTIESTSDRFLLLGRELAEEMKTSLGRRLVVLVSDANEETVEIGFRVLGIFDAESNATEEAYMFTGIAALSDIDGGDRLSEVSVHIDDLSELLDVAAELQNQLPGLIVRSWEELDPFIAEMYKFTQYSVYLLIVALMGTLVFGLINALVTAVLERSREFGLLRAVGLKAHLVVLQVVIECVIIMMIGLALGVGIGLLIYWTIADGIDLTNFASGAESFGLAPRMVPELYLGDFVTIAIASLILGLVASFFPARRIVRTGILESLRNT